MPASETKDKLLIAFTNLGCKLNFAETSYLQNKINKIEFTVVPFNSFADIYVINSCTVTETAEKKGRNVISKAYHLNPNAKIIVIGCQSQISPDAVSQLPGVTLVAGNAEKFDINNLLKKIHSVEPHKKIYVSTRDKISEFHSSVSFEGRTRCFIKVQDGCDYFCSYCIVPYARGKSRSDSVNNVISGIKEAEQRGVQEIILTGVNIGDFGKNTGESLYQLLKSIVSETSIPRIRISSVEPDLLNDEILDLVYGEARIMPHFHLPLQSGSDEILIAMRRRYNTGLFSDIVDKIRKKIPDAFIGVDVITGFPGESDLHYNETFDFLRHLDISALHVFPYSLRKGTKAAEIEEQIHSAIKTKRAKELLCLSDEKKATFYKRFRDKFCSVLVERISKEGYAKGFSENYIPVEIKSDNSLLKNKIVKVKITDITEDFKMQGELI